MNIPSLCPVTPTGLVFVVNCLNPKPGLFCCRLPLLVSVSVSLSASVSVSVFLVLVCVCVCVCACALCVGGGGKGGGGSREQNSFVALMLCC